MDAELKMQLKPTAKTNVEVKSVTKVVTLTVGHPYQSRLEPLITVELSESGMAQITDSRGLDVPAKEMTRYLRALANEIERATQGV